jgi:predicted alpha/beta-fold hydrolase
MLEPSSQEDSVLSPDYTSGGMESFAPRAWLRNRHLQTLATRMLRRENSLPAPERRVFEVEPGVRVACLCHWQQGKQSALTVLIVHGLEGSCESQYVLGTAAKAWAAEMNVVRMNIRACGGTEDLARSLYHSGMVTRALIEQDGLRRIALVGFSMGGNQVLKLAGEWGNAKQSNGDLKRCSAEVKAIAAVSPAMDLGASAAAIHLPENRLYELYFLLSLRARLRKLVECNPGKFKVPKWWWKSLEDFDDTITAPNSGFQGAQDYYSQCSASRVAEMIELPTLVINAADDPFIRLLPETRAKLAANSHVKFVETEHGGHCGFIGDMDGYDGRWAERRVVEFFSGFVDS